MSNDIKKTFKFDINIQISRFAHCQFRFIIAKNLQFFFQSYIFLLVYQVKTNIFIKLKGFCQLIFLKKILAFFTCVCRYKFEFVCILPYFFYVFVLIIMCVLFLCFYITFISIQSLNFNLTNSRLLITLLSIVSIKVRYYRICWLIIIEGRPH